ncbi:hypothetical protein QFC19_001427 [Naganishia cerealis]|uniref:Uncharacterized protein n=1 Tax=Naganishia cerealis TaxID=610337 RepID=A0ACC2WGP6_9TREE|nr:hypothetical protein QFC19_001427 [Naganishia cerealis]
MGDLRQTSSYRNASSLQSSDGFRFPIIQPSAPSLHIRRDGHLPACLNFQSQLEDGEIVEPSQFMDPSDVRPPSTKYTTAENELWGPGPTSNKGSFHGNSSSQIEAHVRTQAITDKYQDSARTRAKGKGKDLIVEYESDLSTEDAAWLANADGQDDYSHDSGTADEDALAQDGYMRTRQAAAIAAQSLVDLARGFGPLAGIEEQITESEAEEEAVAELVIEGDKFLTRDDEGSKLAEKLHLAEIMDGSTEETQRILRKYKNAQLFLEAMGATKAPPVPKTIIHGIRLVSKAKDKKSLPIPQDVYHELMKPEKMEVPYQSMIHLAGPITWAFPKKPIRKRKLPSKKQRPEDTYEKDGEERSESESDFDESRERKKARLSKKRWRQPHAAALPSTLTAELPVVPFSFALDSQGAILFGEDGCPLINPITSLPSDQSPPKRKGNRQVTFSSELNMYNSRAASHPLLQSEGQPQQLSQENMRRAVEFIHQQLQQQQERRENPENHVGFQLDPTLQAFLEQHNQDDQLVTSAKAMLEIPGVSEEQHPVLTHSESDAPQQESSLHLGAAMDDVQGLVIDADSSVLMANRRADMDPFSISPNMDTQTFDTLVAQVQQYQNGSPIPQSHRGFTGNELDAIFDVRSFNIAPDAQERSYDSAIDEAE